MTKKFVAFLQRKYSVLLALIPVVNIIYIFGFFLYCEPFHFLQYGLPIMVGASVLMFLLNRFLLASITWMIPFVILLVVSFLAYLYLRRNLYENRRVSKPRLFLVLIPCVLLVGSVILALQKDQIAPKAEVFLTAIVNQDEQSLNTVTFSGKENIRYITRNNKGIVLEGKVTILKRNSCNISYRDKRKIYENSYDVQIGENLYKVDLIYEKTNRKEGFTSVHITWHRDE